MQSWLVILLNVFIDRSWTSSLVVHVRTHYLGRYSSYFACSHSESYSHCFHFHGITFFAHRATYIILWHKMPRTNKFYANARHHKFKWVWSFSKCEIAYFWEFDKPHSTKRNLVVAFVRDYIPVWLWLHHFWHEQCDDSTTVANPCMAKTEATNTKYDSYIRFKRHTHTHTLHRTKWNMASFYSN